MPMEQESRARCVCHILSSYYSASYLFIFTVFTVFFYFHFRRGCGEEPFSYLLYADLLSFLASGG